MYFENILEKDYPKIAKEIIEFGKNHTIWTFQGNLGAGKTSLIKSLVKEKGCYEKVQSPTFSIVNEYCNKIYHFDCYRIKTVYEALDFGIEEYLDSGKLCLIEWPDRISELLLDEYLEIKIKDTGKNTRNIFVKIVN